MKIPLQITSRNFELTDAIKDLEAGSKVRFVDTEGEKGPQASTVKPF